MFLFFHAAPFLALQWASGFQWWVPIFNVLTKASVVLAVFPVKHVEWCWDWLEEQEGEGALVFSSDGKRFQWHVGVMGRRLICSSRRSGGAAVSMVTVSSMTVSAHSGFRCFHLLLWTSRGGYISSSHFLSCLIFGACQCRALQCRGKMATSSQRHTSGPARAAAQTCSRHWLSLSPYTLCSLPRNLSTNTGSGFMSLVPDQLLEE